jgi:hypothetical protein
MLRRPGHGGSKFVHQSIHRYVTDWLHLEDPRGEAVGDERGRCTPSLVARVGGGEADLVTDDRAADALDDAPLDLVVAPHGFISCVAVVRRPQSG